MHNKGKESNEGISERLESALPNLKLVGGKMHPEEFQAKEKFINTSRSDKDTVVTVEENIIGNIIIDSESDNKYGDLKRFLISSMTHGNNRYPNIKAAAYTMFCKYVPGHTNNKNKSTTICDSPTTSVSFYQRANPVNEPPVAGTIVITKDMITRWKCRRRGHRSKLCPKVDDKGFRSM